MQKKTIGILLAGVVVVGAIVFALFNNSTKKDDTITIRSATAKKMTVTETLSTTGTLIPNNTENLVGTGNVTDLNVKVGDVVKKDQALANYDSGLSLTAGIDGTITEVNIKKGQADTAAQQGKASIIVADLNNLKVQLALSNSEARQVNVDQKAVISSGGHNYAGKVTEKDPTATSTQATTSATLGAVVTFDDKSEKLYAGFSADVDITIATEQNALAIPIEALTYNDKNEPIVYEIKDDKAKITKVETGIQSDQFIVIKKGITDGNQVILSPTSSLKDGSAVTKE
ncbi:HlyD family efflux transporter periplasmic adaptor subunit [Enterococcus canintestini]|uniref:efflux RND transporter periplasmic adaptor subunit n=1 Tax=Enterococcus canintestini TaxID=317010 RepID=UPI002890D402|nr:HlyD family efflux transporter periplasmic adaptor subunit [Enterococcus canintestini]MDT2740650.1 HlyD family efflux transporter periplasmic adaptor subunit [Enterococcus canintestini]